MHDKILDEENLMGSVYITSDQHFGHANIIDYEDRPFTSVDEMNSYMIKKWNQTVSKKDKVFFLGDLCIPSRLYSEIVPLLNGYKIMVMGNHDCLSHKRYEEAGFEEVSRYPIILNDFYILSHAPLYLSKAMPYVNIHGHSHSKRMVGANYYNVCVELHDYKPVKFDDIKAVFALE